MVKNIQIVELRDIITKTLEEHKAEDIVVIDLNGKTDIAEFMIVATGRSSRHVASTADHVMEKIKLLELPYSIEGMSNPEWVLIDILDIMVHIFSREKRELYALEELWQR